MRRGFTRTYYRGEGVYVSEKESERQREPILKMPNQYLLFFSLWFG